jgi:ganglioside-induced differentiation-associated protein 1
MLAFYHFDRSTAAQKVRLALAEKNLPWESRCVDPALDKHQQHDPEYLKLNPRGLVPTLVHEGRVVRESQVILEYLEDVFPPRRCGLPIRLNARACGYGPSWSMKVCT